MELLYARKLLYDFVKQNYSSGKHLSKDNYLIVVQHSFRVENYAQQIANSYVNISYEEKKLLRLAAIFHDIGTVYGRENHAERSKEIVEKLLMEESIKDLDENRLFMLIEKHSEKGEFDDGDILLSILKDADILDHIGAMSILMYASKYDYNNSDYYSNVLKDLVERDIPFCKKQKSLIRTEKGREIIDQKINFIGSFIQQLENEIKDSLLQLEELLT